MEDHACTDRLILGESHTLGSPITLGGADFLVGFETPPNVRNRTAGMLFSKNTCSGCHIENSFSATRGFAFYQIGMRDPGRESQLSAFFSGETQCGESDEASRCVISYVQNELVRRGNIFQQDLGLVGFKSAATAKASGMRGAPLLLHEPSDAEVVTLDSLSRVH